MRKHKSVVAILLAVMMIFTFMPTMAFATTDQTIGEKTAVWADDYSSVTYDGVTYPTIRHMNDYGRIIAEVDDSAMSTKLPANVKAAMTASYYDLEGAVLCDGNNHEYVIRNYTRKDFETAFKNVVGRTWSFKLKRPAYDKTGTAGEMRPTNFSLTPSGYTVQFDPWKLFDPDNDDAQTLIVPIEISIDDDAVIMPFDDDFDTPKDLINGDKLEPITLNVAKKVTEATEAEFEFDGKKTALESTATGTTGSITGGNALTYDGSAYVLKMKEAEGLSVSYKALQGGRYVDVNELSVTNVGDKVQGQAVVKKGTTTVTYSVNLRVVDKGSAAVFGFDEDGDHGYKEYTVIEGEEYDAFSYVLISNVKDPAVKANEAILKEYVKDFYTIDSKIYKSEPSTVYLKLRAKNSDELSDADAQKLREGKYKELLSNLQTPYVRDIDDEDYAEVYIVPASKDYEVTFTKAIRSKTYKGKKYIKKGKLKKDQAIQFTAEAANGKTVVYKLINVNTSKIKIDSATGKLTLKKGLAKGKYEFKVKAYVPNNPYATETQNVTIKVNKK